MGNLQLITAVLLAASTSDELYVTLSKFVLAFVSFTFPVLLVGIRTDNCASEK